MSSINFNQQAKATFSFDDLEKAVSGKYNRGELRLNGEGALEKLNSHVWRTSLNKDSSTSYENIAVRNAVYRSIENKFGGRDVALSYLATVREFLLGDANFAKPLSRDEVRAVISHLKTLTTDVEAAKNKLERLTTAHNKADSEWTRLTAVENNRAHEVTAGGVKEKYKAFNRARSSFQTALNSFNKVIAFHERKMGDFLGALLPEMLETDPDKSALADAYNSFRATVTSLVEYNGTSNDAADLFASGLKNEIKEFQAALEKYAKAHPDCADEIEELGIDYESGKFRDPFANIKDGVNELIDAKKELVNEHNIFDLVSQQLQVRLEVDQLVDARTALEAKIRGNPANVEELKRQLEDIDGQITVKRMKVGIDDGRKAGTLGSKEIKEFQRALGNAAERTQELDGQMKTAQKDLDKATAKASRLNVADFAKQLNTIRKIKEGKILSVEDFKKSDGTTFDKADLISGLRAGYGRGKTVLARTENESDKSRLARQLSGVEAQVRAERKDNRAQLRELSDTFAENLNGEFYYDLKYYSSATSDGQARCVHDALPKLLRKVVDSTDDENVKSALTRDIARLKEMLDKRLESFGAGKRTLSVENDYRGMLMDAHSVLQESYLADLPETRKLRKELANAIFEFSQQDYRVDMSDVEKKPGEISSASHKMWGFVAKLKDKIPELKLDLAHLKDEVDAASGEVDMLQLGKASRHAAKVLVAALKMVDPNAADFDELAELAKNTGRGQDGLDLFVQQAKTRIQSSELREALDEAALQFVGTLDVETRKDALVDQLLASMKEVFNEEVARSQILMKAVQARPKFFDSEGMPSNSNEQTRLLRQKIQFFPRLLSGCVTKLTNMSQVFGSKYSVSSLPVDKFMVKQDLSEQDFPKFIEEIAASVASDDDQVAEVVERLIRGLGEQMVSW